MVYPPEDTEWGTCRYRVLDSEGYEWRNIPALAALIPTLLASSGEVLLSDPRRKNTPAFLERMREKGFHSSTVERLVPSDGREVVVLVHRLWRF